MRKRNDTLFKQTDAERLLRAHLAMGISVVIEVAPDGSLKPIPVKPVAAENESRDEIVAKLK